ncbi:metal ABC transporter permease [Corynebacterium variabile]|uniref:metal ABC transporter permease n=1 Tax=Corynebacterium variabile TaxID=1727 RepID=UPI00289F2B31|nr:metal ABC transporter permease [Corynebacterium variabile]
MEILTDPFEVSFVFRALLAGSFTAVLCACVGTWVVLRGLSFFGDVLGVGSTDVLTIGIAALVGLVACVVMYRPFTALTFDPRKSQTLGLRPGFAHVAMLILVALATVASFQIVGTLLVFGMLIGPPATAVLLVRGIGRVMVLAAVLGVAQVYVGLLVSWYAETAAGATITLLGGLTFLVVLAVREVVCRVHPANANDNHVQ